MIVGIGCDIAEHHLAGTLGWGSDLSVLQRIFSEEEISLSKLDIRFFSGRFAAKESIVKCFGTGLIDGVALPDIQILRASNGSPVVVLSNSAKQISETMGINLWHVSITHTDNYSLALAIAEKI